MDKFIITGGNKLYGDVNISGAKNAAVAIIPAVIPNIKDVSIIARILQQMGAIVKMVNRTTLEIDPRHIVSPVASYELVHQMRASYYLLGALLGRFSRAVVAMPGGCDFSISKGSQRWERIII